MSTYDRIVNGQTASAPIPWQVSLRRYPDGNGHFCGGIVLDSKTILTAAHCQVETSNYIMVGKVNRMEGQNIKVSKVINADWNENTMDNDVAILKLSTPLTMGKDVQAICLPSAGFNPAVGSTCIVSGWGLMKEGGPFLPTNLQYVAVPVISQATCKAKYLVPHKPGAAPIGITDNMICAGLTAGGKDSCQADSGGPFVCMENGKPVITGIVSFGIGCARAEYPGVYAKVTKYLTWIKSHMETTVPTPAPPTPAPTPALIPVPTPAPTHAPICGNESYKGDGFCDDNNNNAGCAFDEYRVLY